MKVILFFLFPAFIFAQESPGLRLDESGKYYLEQIIKSPYQAPETFNRVKIAIAKIYPFLENPIKIQTDTSLLITGVLYGSYQNRPLLIYHVLEIYVKDYRIKTLYTGLNFEYKNQGIADLSIKPGFIYGSTIISTARWEALKKIIELNNKIETELNAKQKNW